MNRPASEPVCGVCESQALNLIHDQRGSRYFPRRIYRCRRCGYAFVHPMPDRETLQRLYADPGYFTERASPGQAGQVNLGQLQRAESRLDWLRPWLTDAKILDIGCGNGEFILKASERGLDVHGLEISPAAAHTAAALSGAQVYVDDPQGLALTGARFDLISAWDVIEHIPDPAGFIRACVSLLNDHGLIALSTPNQRNYHGVLHGIRWKGYRDGPEHLHFFNKNTLGRLMRRNGFVCVRSRTCRISPVLLRWLAPLGFGNELEAIYRLTS